MKNDYFGSFEQTPFAQYFAHFIRTSHEHLKKMIPREEQLLGDLPTVKFHEISEFSYNFSGKVQVSQECKTCKLLKTRQVSFLQMNLEEMQSLSASNSLWAKMKTFFNRNFSHQGALEELIFSSLERVQKDVGNEMEKRFEWSQEN